MVQTIALRRAIAGGVVAFLVSAVYWMRRPDVMAGVAGTAIAISLGAWMVGALSEHESALKRSFLSLRASSIVLAVPYVATAFHGSPGGRDEILLRLIVDLWWYLPLVLVGAVAFGLVAGWRRRPATVADPQS